MKTLKLPDRIKLAHLPTPIEKLKNQDLPDGPTIYIKRDDMTGMLFSGNKIRKLEFAVAEALQQNADTLITCGGVQSNHARATAVVATKLGMKSVLVLRGDANSDIEGNLLVDHLMGADVRFITPEQYRDDVGGIMERIAEELRGQGRQSYILPEGASNAIGAMGYLAATEEIATQLSAMNVNIDAVVCATGSGGTQAGLIMGKKLHHLNYEVYGVNVCDDEDYFTRKIYTIIETARQRFHLDLTIRHNEIRILDGYVGEGYALNRPQEIEFIKSVAKDEGIVLDPVYTGKALLGLMDQIKKGRFSQNSNILFLHSGGLFGLFPKKNMFY